MTRKHAVLAKVEFLTEQDGRYRYRRSIPAKLRPHLGNGKNSWSITLEARPPDLDAALIELRRLRSEHDAEIRRLRRQRPVDLVRQSIQASDGDNRVRLIANVMPHLPDGSGAICLPGPYPRPSDERKAGRWPGF
jgi:hypothetical protein